MLETIVFHNLSVSQLDPGCFVCLWCMASSSKVASCKGAMARPLQKACRLLPLFDLWVSQPIGERKNKEEKSLRR